MSDPETTDPGAHEPLPDRATAVAGPSTLRRIRPARRIGAAFWVTVGLLAVFNIVRAVGWFGTDPLPGAVGLTAVLAAVAWWSRLGAERLGLLRDDVGSGIRWGGAVLALWAVAMLVASAIPATAAFLDDPRVDVTGTELIGELLVGVLLVTVIPEELAFRGVLLGAGRAMWGGVRATLVTSALFGLWHIAPTLHTLTENRALTDTVDTPVGTALVVAGSVLSTAVAGVVFCWLRLRSRSLLAPMIAHVATNGIAFVVAWFVTR